MGHKAAARAALLQEFKSLGMDEDWAYHCA